MTWFDIIILGTLGFSTLFAFGRGVMREGISLMALAIGFVSALYLSGPLGAMVGANSSTLFKLFIFLAVFVAIFIMTLLVLEGLRGKFTGKDISLVDRLLGAVFGLLRGYLLIGGFYLIIDYYAVDGEEPDGFKNAATLPIARSAGDLLENIGLESLPGESVEIQDKTDNGDGAS